MDVNKNIKQINFSWACLGGSLSLLKSVKLTYMPYTYHTYVYTHINIKFYLKSFLELTWYLISNAKQREILFLQFIPATVIEQTSFTPLFTQLGLWAVNLIDKWAGVKYKKECVLEYIVRMNILF